MKADRYLFDGSHPCALRKLPCDSKDDHVKKEDILAKTAENLEKMAALQDASEELHHDFLWRVNKALPPRGSIAIFNRSYYEDVLVVQVHDLQKT